MTSSLPAGMDWLAFIRDENENGWEHDAACRDTDPELWFPPGNRNTRNARRALRICAECPVAAECLAHALTIGPTVRGIWGGTTDADRRKLSR